MKILFVTRSTPLHLRGGMELIAWDLGRRLAQRGHSIVFLTTTIPSPQDYLEAEFLRVDARNAPPGRYSRRWWRQSRQAFAEQYLESVDLVFGIGGGAHSIVTMPQDLDRRIPILLQSHGTPWGEIRSQLTSMSFRSALGAVRNALNLVRDWRLSHYTTIVAVGPAVTQDLGSAPMRWLKGRTPVVTIPNGVDEALFAFDADARARWRASLGLCPADVVVISASKISTQKGIFESLDAFADMATTDPNAKYLIVGDGPQISALRRAVADRGLADRTTILGGVPREEMPGLYSAADCYLFLSLRKEGLALAPLEAVSTGLPIVMSPHAVPPGLDAWAVDPRDTRAASLAIRHAIAQRQGDRESKLLPAYTLSRSVDAYEDLFLSFCKPH